MRVSEKTYVPNEWTHAAMTISNDTVTFYEMALPWELLASEVKFMWRN